MSQSPKYILVVDDEAMMAKLISVHLSVEGYRIETALTGEGALEKIKHEKPALVLLDMLLPGIDGVETLKRMRGIHPDLSVVMVTGVYDPEEGKRAYAAGAMDYVTKPIDFQYLKSTILTQLS